MTRQNDTNTEHRNEWAVYADGKTVWQRGSLGIAGKTNARAYKI